MKLSIGFSPCPNDTFIFDAMMNNKIDTEGLEFEVFTEDVETLNQWAQQGKLDITKLSFPAYFQNSHEYILLNSGAALGKGVGPLLVSKYEIRSPNTEIERSNIALPGKNTTAHLLFTFAYPSAKKKQFMVFSEIEDAVLHEKSELGVIIHENRFTYHKKGLKKVTDLGEYWEEKMLVPVPLGGIAIKRSVDRLTGLKVEKLIRKSLEYAWLNYPVLNDYVKNHAQEMDEDIMRKHIELYVNDFTVSLNREGKKAIRCLHEVYLTTQNLQEKDISSGDIFLS